MERAACLQVRSAFRQVPGIQMDPSREVVCQEPPRQRAVLQPEAGAVAGFLACGQLRFPETGDDGIRELESGLLLTARVPPGLAVCASSWPCCLCFIGSLTAGRGSGGIGPDTTESLSPTMLGKTTEPSGPGHSTVWESDQVQCNQLLHWRPGNVCQDWWPSPGGS